MAKNKRLRAALLAVLTIALVVAAVVVPIEAWSLTLTEADLWRGPKGVALFVFIYIVWNFAFPPAPLQLLAGMHYGLFGGLIVIVIGTSLANVISHGLARWLGRTWVADYVEENPHVWALEQAITRLGWKAVVLLRLSNLIPSNVANLLMGVTPLKLSTILWATMLGSLPGWALMLVLGEGGRALIDTEDHGATTWLLFAAGIITSLVLLAAVGRKAMAILEEEAESQED